VHERAEGRVSLHTSRERVAEIVVRAQREHPYEVPACPHDRSSTETRTTSHGSPKRPIPGVGKRTDQPPNAHGRVRRVGRGHDHRRAAHPRARPGGRYPHLV
jgi:hypothetical protein